jgi:hypothetical protein
MAFLQDDQCDIPNEYTHIEIMKNRCELIESQLKTVMKMCDDTKLENDKLKEENEKIKAVLTTVYKRLDDIFEYTSNDDSDSDISEEENTTEATLDKSIADVSLEIKETS